MSDTALYINAFCGIANNKLWLNGQNLFMEPGLPPEDFLIAAYKFSGVEYPKFYKMDHLAQLGFLASEFVLKDKDRYFSYQPEDIGLVFSNAHASLDADIHYFETVKNIPSPAQFVYTLPNIVMGEVSIRHRLKGENAFFVSERFNAPLLYWYMSDLMRRQKIKACVCGWVDYWAGAYKAVLFWVEKDKRGTLDQVLNIDNLQNIYALSDGEING